MQMSAGKVAHALETVESRFRSILETNSSVVMAKAKSSLNRSSREFQRLRRHASGSPSLAQWGYAIHHTDPLRFLPTEVDGVALRVDVFLKSYWAANPAPNPSELNVVIRVWCLDKRIYFRRELDAHHLEEQIDPRVGRVILRFHFDLANVGQPGPSYHLQIGGKSQPDEHNWLSKSLSVPRFLHSPVDLVLAAELIAANFYPDDFDRIRREPAWVGTRNTSQGHLLASYYERSLAAVNNQCSVLEALWNLPWD